MEKKTEATMCIRSRAYALGSRVLSRKIGDEL